jgi:hypothetical protein
VLFGKSPRSLWGSFAWLWSAIGAHKIVRPVFIRHKFGPYSDEVLQRINRTENLWFLNEAQCRSQQKADKLRAQVLAAVITKMAAFWVVAPCGLVLDNEGSNTSETSVNFYQTTRRYNPDDRHLELEHASPDVKSVSFLYVTDTKRQSLCDQRALP